VFDGTNGSLDDLILGHAELVLHVDFGCRDESVDARPLRSFHRVPRDLQVARASAGEAADDGDVAVVVDGVPDVEGDSTDGLEVIGGRDGEPCLDDVDAELGELE